MQNVVGKVRVEMEVRRAKLDSFEYRDKTSGKMVTVERLLVNGETLGDYAPIVVIFDAKHQPDAKLVTRGSHVVAILRTWDEREGKGYGSTLIALDAPAQAR